MKWALPTVPLAVYSVRVFNAPSEIQSTATLTEDFTALVGMTE